MNAIEQQIQALEELQKPQNINPILLTVHQQVKRRIHDQGRAANNSQIGTYSEGYLKTRRKKGLGGSRKVILELTGQMRRDFVPIKQGRYIIGSGFNNRLNLQKSKWVERTYRKVIYALTRKESNLLTELLQNKADKLTDASS